MRRSRVWTAALTMASMAIAAGAKAQTAVYVQGSADYLNNGPYADFLYGGTVGATVDLAQMLHEKVTLAGDVQGNFAVNNTSPGGGLSHGEDYDVVTFGPRMTWSRPVLGVTPFVQMNVGFGRYHDPTVHSATDYVIGGQAGVNRRLTGHLDAVLDYSYSAFGYNFGYYSPQTFSAGLMYHFTKH